MDLDIDGRLAVVTGGSRGIGLAVAQRLASEGADVAIVGRDEAAAAAACAGIEERTGRRASPFQADTGDDASVAAVVEAIAATFGRIDILVNGASLPGGGGFRPLADTDAATMLVDLNVKVMGYLRTARQVAPHMQARGWGRIVNIGGIAAYSTGSIDGSIRCAAVGALTKNLADELGAQGIMVNAVHPGPTLTDRSINVVRALAKEQNKTEAEIEQGFASTSVRGRFAAPDEIASVVAFLSSPLAVTINGASIELAGGTKGTIRY